MSIAVLALLAFIAVLAGLIGGLVVGDREVIVPVALMAFGGGMAAFFAVALIGYFVTGGA